MSELPSHLPTNKFFTLQLFLAATRKTKANVRSIVQIGSCCVDKFKWNKYDSHKVLRKVKKVVFRHRCSGKRICGNTRYDEIFFKLPKELNLKEQFVYWKGIGRNHLSISRAWLSDYFGRLSPNLCCLFKHCHFKCVICCLLAAQTRLDLLVFVKVQKEVTPLVVMLLDKFEGNSTNCTSV